MKKPSSNLRVLEIRVWLMERELEGVRVSLAETGEKQRKEKKKMKMKIVVRLIRR